MPLRRFLDEPLVDPDSDDVSRLILDQHREDAFRPIADLTVGEFRDWLLDYDTTGEVLRERGLGRHARNGRGRVQAHAESGPDPGGVQDPHRHGVSEHDRPAGPALRSAAAEPSDRRPAGIAASILDGLLYGCGDAVIGINPATDNLSNTLRLLELMDELIHRLEIPTQSCVLAHVTTQMQAMSGRAGRSGVSVDRRHRGRQRSRSASLWRLLDEARPMALELARGTRRRQRHVLRDRPGHRACRPMRIMASTSRRCEARAYAVARRYEPLLVNTVVGFIGPEYLYDGKQIIRAGLEDHFCGKLLGLPMGCDVCYTNHAEADQDDMDNLLTLLGVAGCNYIMGVPGADDIMLSYQSTSFHDAHFLRQTLGLRPAPEFEEWLLRDGPDRRRRAG